MKSKPSVPPIDPPKRNTTVGPVDEADDEAIELVLIEKQKNISKKEDEINSHIKKHEANSIYCSAIDRGLDQIAFSFCKHSSILKKNNLSPEMFLIQNQCENEKPTQKEIGEARMNIKMKKQNNENLMQQIEQQNKKMEE